MMVSKRVIVGRHIDFGASCWFLKQQIYMQHCGRSGKATALDLVAGATAAAAAAAANTTQTSIPLASILL
jgi:hypothetical protein